MRYNALLRGEQRNTEVAANHLKHKKPTHSKNATRCESLLNNLLGVFICLTVRFFFHWRIFVPVDKQLQ